ncbi:hypothetical protein GQ457_13G029610 [Hibiscus cannabinus]
MSEAYERAKGGRLTFKGGSLATRKSIDKSKKKQKKKKIADDDSQPSLDAAASAAVVEGSETGGSDIYTIDAAKKMKYEELFPVEAKKFGYDPKNPKVPSVEQALDDRVKKKADPNSMGGFNCRRPKISETTTQVTPFATFLVNENPKPSSFVEQVLQKVPKLTSKN